jgi:hypothetical protein
MATAEVCPSLRTRALPLTCFSVEPSSAPYDEVAALIGAVAEGEYASVAQGERVSENPPYANRPRVLSNRPLIRTIVFGWESLLTKYRPSLLSLGTRAR